MKCLLLSLVIAAATHSAIAAPPALPRLKLLIIDGVNNHDWPRTTKIVKAILEDSGRFAVDVSTSPAADALGAEWDCWLPDFAPYGVILSNFNGGNTAKGIRWTPEMENRLERYVRKGGGLVVFHAANNAFSEWPAYNEMIGLGWRDKSFGPSLVISSDEKVVEIPRGEGRNPGHGPEHDFPITVLNADHPITHGMPKKWMHPHEQLTHGQHGPAKNLTVLTYAWSRDAKENEPMDWVVSYGKGRVYTTMLGHLWKDGPDTALRCVGFRTLLIRGCEWAATGKVSYPIPANFPTATKIRLAGPAVKLDITTKRSGDRVEATIEGDTATLDIRSLFGISGATVALAKGDWPAHINLRLHLRGLESFTASSGKVKLEGSVTSHGDYSRHFSLTEDGKAGKPIAESAIKVVDANGKPIKGLPDEGGRFEIELPNELFENGAKQFVINWIDFYRG